VIPGSSVSPPPSTAIQWRATIERVAELHPRLRLGTSSWSSDDWKTAGFYPREMEPRDYLKRYSERFPIVEVDSSFYRAPTASMCDRWAEITPQNFTFTLKVPQSITHEKALEDCEKEWEALLSAVTRLGPKLGYLVLQFGYFNKSSTCPTLGEFLRRLGPFVDQAKSPCPLVVEVRNRPWVGEDLLGFLRERKMIFALCDQEWMPKPRELWKKHWTRLLTGPSAYIRLLGERKRIDALTTTWEKLVIDRTPETREIIAIIREILEAPEMRVDTLVNNHFGGYAVASIELLERLWQEP